MYSQQSNQVAAVEIQAGNWLSALSWCLAPAGFRYWVTIEGVEHEVPFAKPTVFQVTPGFQEVEICLSSWFGQYQPMRYSFNLAPGTIQPLLYRYVYTTFGVIFAGFKLSVLKPGMVRSYAPNGYPANVSRPLQQHSPQPQYQQPAFQQPHYQQPTYQHHQGNGYQPEPPASSQFTSPFTDSDYGQQAAPTTTAPAVARAKFCTQCGTELVAGNRFCGGCGHAIG